MIRLFICTPAYLGKVNVQYAVSLAETYRILGGYGIDVKFKLSTSGSLLCAERNRLTEEFMLSGATHMLCIDADLGWNAESVLNMFKYQEDFVVGCYPARRGKDFLFRPIFNSDNKMQRNEKGLFPMQYVPAGFMLIKRCVIEKMREYFPELKFVPKDQANAPHPFGYSLFETKVMEGEFWGEDYIFCHRAAQAGIKIFCDPTIQFDHDGIQGSLIEALVEQPKNNTQQILENKSPEPISILTIEHQETQPEAT